MIMSGGMPAATLRKPTAVTVAQQSMRFSWNSVPTCANRQISTEPRLILPMPYTDSRLASDFSRAKEQLGYEPDYSIEKAVLDYGTTLKKLEHL